MVTDHSCESYYNALLEIRSVQNAKVEAPDWQPYSACDSCNCCKSEFTWNSTSDSEAQLARDKYNCFGCGLLVCDPCSQKTSALPEFGIEQQRRVCDSCFYDLGFREDGEGSVVLARSYVTDPGSQSSGKNTVSAESAAVGLGDHCNVASTEIDASRKFDAGDAGAKFVKNRRRTNSGRRRSSSIVSDMVSNLKQG